MTDEASIEIRCPKCGARYGIRATRGKRVPDTLRARCPKCGTQFIVRTKEDATPSPPVQAPQDQGNTQRPSHPSKPLTAVECVNKLVEGTRPGGCEAPLRIPAAQTLPRSRRHSSEGATQSFASPVYGYSFEVEGPGWLVDDEAVRAYGADPGIRRDNVGLIGVTLNRDDLDDELSHDDILRLAARDAPDAKPIRETTAHIGDETVYIVEFERGGQTFLSAGFAHGRDFVQIMATGDKAIRRYFEQVIESFSFEQSKLLSRSSRATDERSRIAALARYTHARRDLARQIFRLCVGVAIVIVAVLMPRLAGPGQPFSDNFFAGWVFCMFLYSPVYVLACCLTHDEGVAVGCGIAIFALPLWPIASLVFACCNIVYLTKAWRTCVWLRPKSPVTRDLRAKIKAIRAERHRMESEYGTDD